MLKPSGGRLSLEMSVTFTPALLVTCNSINNFCTPGVGLGFKTEKRNNNNNNNNKMVTIVRTSLFICSFFLSFFAVVRIGLYVVSSLVTIVRKSFCPRKSTRTSNSKSKSEKERKGAREPESKSKNTSKSKNKKSKSERAGPQDSKITQQEKSRKKKQTRQEQEQKNKRTKEQKNNDRKKKCPT